MGLIIKNIEAIEQPVQLLSRQRQSVARFGPAEALLLQAFIPHNKTIVLPAQ